MTVTMALITFLIAFSGAGFIATRFCLRCTLATGAEIAWLTFTPTLAFIITLSAIFLTVPGSVTPDNFTLATVYLKAFAEIWPFSGFVAAGLSYAGVDRIFPTLAFACRCKTDLVQGVVIGRARAKYLHPVPDLVEPSDS